MPLNPKAVGTSSGPFERSWESKDCLLYAVGVGAGLDELAFTTENSHDVKQVVLPTFAVIIGMGGAAMASAGEIDFTRLVHGAQSIRLFKPIPTDGSIKTTDTLTSMQDKGEGKHAILETTATSIDAKTGDKLLETVTTIVLRGQGGFGGERGEAKEKPTPPDRAPDHEVTYQTRDDQALTYRLSGDRNPLHSDPWFAAARRVREADPARAVHLRLHRPGTAARAVRRRPRPLRRDGGPLLVAGVPGRGPHNARSGSTATRPPTRPPPHPTAASSSTTAASSTPEAKGNWSDLLTS